MPTERGYGKATSWFGRKVRSAAASIGIALSASIAPTAVHAVDGCKLLLCLAGNWKSIPLCAPTVHEAFRDMARGRPFPTCGMSGAGNSGAHRWANAPTYCPPQYTRELPGNSSVIYECEYRGAVTVTINGRPWSRVWWTGDDTSTEYFDDARVQLGDSIDPKFDRDHAAWSAAQPPAPDPSHQGGY